MAAYTGTLTEQSARYADQYLLGAAQLNVDNFDNTWSLALPSDWSGALFLEAIFEQTGIRTPATSTDTNFRPLAIEAFVVSTAGAPLQPIDVAELHIAGTAANAIRMAAHFSPDQPPLVRQQERIVLFIPTTETETTDDSDYYVGILARRLYDI